MLVNFLGFYRVNYDDVNWALLTRALRSSNRTVIHELNRAQVIFQYYIKLHIFCNKLFEFLISCSIEIMIKFLV